MNVSEREELLETMMGVRPGGSATVIPKIVPREADLSCGRDSIGTPLKPGDKLVCLCCGVRGEARVLTEEDEQWDNTFAFPGSHWVKISGWLEEAVARTGARAHLEGPPKEMNP